MHDGDLGDFCHESLILAIQAIHSKKSPIDVTLRLDIIPTSYQTNKKPFKDSQPPQKANTSQGRGGSSPRPPRMDQEMRNDLRRRSYAFHVRNHGSPDAVALVNVKFI